MVGEKFKAIRKAKGLTLEGAAKMLGIKSSGHLSMVERGDREPSDALVNNFKLTFSVSETWWETGEGEMLILSSTVRPRSFFFPALTPKPVSLLSKYSTDSPDVRAIFSTLVLVSLNDGIHGSEKICSKFVLTSSPP